jgi:hypothetical protein
MKGFIVRNSQGEQCGLIFNTFEEARLFAVELHGKLGHLGHHYNVFAVDWLWGTKTLADRSAEQAAAKAAEALTNTERNDETYGPALSVTGVKAAHAKRAIQWLKDRSYLAFYREADSSLNALEYPKGRDWTYEMLHDAIDETRQ